ncbi:hypothetical protein ACWDX6_23905 [Streptomyces sp. NPDC003027]
MSRLPSLDDYDVQGVRSAEAAMWGDDVRYGVEALEEADTFGCALDCE